MEKDIIVKVCEETATCNSCHAANYDSKFFPKDRKRVEKLYEIHVGGIVFRLCAECASDLVTSLVGIVTPEKTEDDNSIKIEGIGPVQFKDLDDFERSCLMPLISFHDDVDAGYICDDDGSGDFVLDDKIVTTAHVWVDLQTVMFDRPNNSCVTYTFSELRDMFGPRAQIAWYNK